MSAETLFDGIRIPREFKIPNELIFNVLIEREEDGLWTAHCLEMDIVADGETYDEAQGNLIVSIANQVLFHIAKGTPQHILKPAPGEYWAKYFFHATPKDPFHYSPTFEIDEEPIPLLSNVISRVNIALASA